MAKTFYTYTLSSSKNPEIPFYIGKGFGKRMYIHERLAVQEKHPNLHLQRKIRNILNENNEIIIQKVIDNISEDIAFAKEKELISYYKSIGIKLCNLTDGGEGASGYICSQELRKRLSKLHKGMIFSEEHRKNISKHRKGSKASDIAKHNISISKIGTHLSNECRLKISESNKGKHNFKFSKEWKDNLSKSHLGKKMSEVTKKRMSEAKILWHANKKS